MNEVLYKLDSFEGPLELLLLLIKKNKVDIYDIPIAEITEQYLQAIDGIENSALDSTGEFIVMAAQLLYIKSKMLLPKMQEDEEDPREELRERLLEYQKYKEASEELRKSEFSAKDIEFRGEEKIDFPTPEYSVSHDVSALVDAFNSIFSRRIRQQKPQKAAFYGIVGREKASVGEMSKKVLDRIKTRGKVNFRTLFSVTDSKPVMIATFLAVLEMIKENTIWADFDRDTGDFILTQKDGVNNG